MTTKKGTLIDKVLAENPQVNPESIMKARGLIQKARKLGRERNLYSIKSPFSRHNPFPPDPPEGGVIRR